MEDWSSQPKRGTTHSNAYWWLIHLHTQTSKHFDPFFKLTSRTLLQAWRFPLFQKSQKFRFRVGNGQPLILVRRTRDFLKKRDFYYLRQLWSSIFTGNSVTCLPFPPNRNFRHNFGLSEKSQSISSVTYEITIRLCFNTLSLRGTCAWVCYSVWLFLVCLFSGTHAS